MKRKGEVFRRAFLICIVLLIVCIILLLGVYTYFGRNTFVNLERDQLNKTADSAQELFAHPVDQTLSRTTFRGYLDAISYSNEISYVLLFLREEKGTYYFSTNIEDYEGSPYIREIYERVLGGEEIELTNFKVTETNNAICAGRPIYSDEDHKLIGCFILIKEISNVNGAFTLLSRSLWIVSFFLLPLLILTAYFSVNQMLHPVAEMTDVARQLSKGNYEVRAKESYPGELGLFARTLNNMSRALSSTIRQLENEKRQLGYILSSFSEGVAAINKQGELTHYNPALMKMFGTVDIHSPMDLVPDRTIWDAFDAVVD